MSVSVIVSNVRVVESLSLGGFMEEVGCEMLYRHDARRNGEKFSRDMNVVDVKLS